MKNLDFVGKYKSKIISLLLLSENLAKLINPKEYTYLERDDVLLGGVFYILNDHQVSRGTVGSVEEIIQGHIFDHLFITSTTTDCKTFIIVEVLPSAVRDNIFTNFELFIYIFSDKSLVRLNEYSTPTSSEMNALNIYGNRIDALCSVVDKLLNGNSSFGIGDVSPDSNRYEQIYIPNENYYGKVLKYNVKNYNDSGDICEN